MHRKASVHRVADAYESRGRRSKTAGEVRFIKDKSTDTNQWAWGDSGTQKRSISPNYAFNPKNTEPLAKVLLATTAGLGHAMSAYDVFVKLKSAEISPDGSLGGRGYIQKIAEMRRAYVNVIEALSSLSDTLHDEIRAPHWAAVSREGDEKRREQLEAILSDVMTIKQDPEAWAEGQENALVENSDD